jgi:hypothetical protein
MTTVSIRSTCAALVGALLVALPLLPAQARPDKAKKPKKPKTAPFLVGAATASADPTTGVCLGGYGAFCTRPMTGIKDPLTTAGTAITGADGPTIIIVKATAVGLFAAYKPEQGATGIYDVRQRISEATGVPASNVVVTSDHSHAAPDTIGIWGGVDRSYMELLAASIVHAGVGAYEARQPAHISVASVDGPELQSSYSQAPTNDAATDEEFRVLFADTPDGTPIATLINYAPHATVCGDCSDMASGDWTAWAAQEVERRGLGIGVGFVGALGSTDWRKSGDQDAREAEARTRINTLLDAAIAEKRRVRGDTVGADVVFINEPLAQPVLLANLFPAGVLNYGEGDVRIDRSTQPPFLTGPMIGTYVGALRVGDVFLSTFPGEPFPQLQDALRDGGVEASEHFLLGAANDFLGYMVANDAEYQQTLKEGATFLPGCPEEAVTHRLPGEHDGACPDHWTLMVSPTIGRHAVCTIQDGADRLGFATGPRDDRCENLTRLDGQNAPAENEGGTR